ncbi:MAG: transcriptional regulator, LysR family [Firmicutes bacterium]|nr:transcriptional regulator, LysR family [Bacillota bacterium]
MNGDLELYRIFHTVAYYKNISRAAEALYISQPAVSKSIQKLENAIGVKLFMRSSRGVTLTSEGKILYDYIKKALDVISDGENILTQLKNKDQGTITIGVSTTLCKNFLLPHLKPFMNKYPEIQIKIINNTTLDTLAHIDEEVIDLGIVSHPLTLPSYHYIDVAIIQDIFVATKSYLTSINVIAPNDIFSKCKFMLLETSNITRQYLDQYLIENNIFIKPEIEISNMDFLIEFAKLGLGISAVIKNFVTQELNTGTLVEIPVIPSIPSRSIGIIFSKKTSLSIAAQTFLEYYKTALGNTL